MPQRPNSVQPKKRHRVLLVDDNPTNVELLYAQLKPYGYELIKAFDGEEALQKIEDTPPDLLLLDLMMPKVSGYEVCEKIKNDPRTQLIPVIVITALKELEDKIKAIQMGADDFLMKPFNKVELVTRVKSLLKLKDLYDDVDRSETIIFTLAEMLEAKDVYTRGHSERVAQYSILLGKAIGLGQSDLQWVHRGALLHDVGKIGIRESVLNKPDKLSQEEMAHIRSHPARGCEICRHLSSLAPLLPIIRHHHERVDGGGYPDGLQMQDIAIGPRIVAIADTYDAMTSNRPYRHGIDPLEALKILEKEQDDGQWDPELVRHFVRLMKEKLTQ